MKKKILISSGGTGGHVIPAIALLEHLKDNFEVLLVLDKRGSNYVNKEKYKYKIVNSSRLSLNFLKLPWTLITFLGSILKSFFLLKNNNIDILIGTGGYMSVPICIVAKILNIKVYLFEPNAVIGRANKFLVKFCNKIFCYSEEIINFPKKYKNKIYKINHILRKNTYEFVNFKKEEINKKVKLLIIGGSQGARFFDENLKKSIVSISKKYSIKIYHQVSNSDLNNLESFYANNGIESKLFNFEDNISQYINEANIAITRAGASTLSELALLKVPFIAIPYKFALDNHQLENALYYKENDCCWLLKEEEFDENKLTTLLIKIIENREEYLNKKKSLEKFSYQNSWNEINKKLIECLNEN